MNLKPHPSGCLLVLEDSDEDFDTILAAAKESNLKNEIIRVTNGDECVELLGKKAQEDATFNPLLALFDLNTPQGDGRYALKTLRENARYKTLPIVILSTSENKHDLEFCYHAGANAYHTKSVSYPAHLRTVRQIFEYWLDGVILPFAQ